MARQKGRAGGSVPSAPSASKTRAAQSGRSSGFPFIKLMRNHSPMWLGSFDPTMPRAEYGPVPTGVRDPLGIMPKGDVYQARGAMASMMDGSRKGRR